MWVDLEGATRLIPYRMLDYPISQAVRDVMDKI